MAQQDHAKFVRQLFYYDIRNSRDEAWKLYAQFCLPFYVFGIKRRTLAQAIVPLLDSEEEHIARRAGSWLKAIEAIGNAKECEHFENFDVYRTAISPDALSQSLVRYLYHRSPSSALLLMIDMCSRAEKNTYRDIVWADHVVRTAIWEIRHGFAGKSNSLERAVRQLDTLSKHSKWWVRLYVAKIMARHRFLRIDDATQRLQKDPHPLVQEAALWIDPKQRKHE